MVPEKNGFLFDALVHPFDGPFYWERSAHTKLDRIRVPAYLASRWNAWFMHLPGAIAAYAGIQAPKKLMMHVLGLGPGAGASHPGRAPDRPWDENHDVILRWYDHWLKGIDTGIMDEPPITLFVQGVNQWRYEHEWPLARTRWTKVYLRQNGTLAETPATVAENPDSFTNIPCLRSGQEAPFLTYATPPLEQDVEVTGPIALNLYAALSTQDANWMVEIHDVDVNGSARLVTLGMLKASHRELDESRSKPYQPFHSHTRSVPIEPGKIYESNIEIRETSNVFRAGHRIQLEIRGQERAAPWGRFLANSSETLHTVFHDSERQSHLLLPIIP